MARLCGYWVLCWLWGTWCCDHMLSKPIAAVFAGSVAALVHLVLIDRGVLPGKWEDR